MVAFYVRAVGQPDLRNLVLYYQPLAENDLVFAVSDGVHDNLDPQVRICISFYAR